LFAWACIGALCSSAASLAIMLWPVIVQQSTISSSISNQVWRRPSTYMNLEKVLSMKKYLEPTPSIINFPPVLLQIHTLDHTRAMHEDYRQWKTQEGTIYSDDRHFVTKATTATVLQFRHLDYAMERCILNVTVPVQTEPLDAAENSRPASILDVWVLDSSLELSPYALWDRAPTRRARFTSLEVSPGSGIASEEFPCPSGQFSTFEITCAPQTPDCYVDFWQNRRAPAVQGIFLTQSSSLALFETPRSGKIEGE